MVEFKFVVPNSHPTLGVQPKENWRWLRRELMERFGGYHQGFANGQGPYDEDVQLVRVYYVGTRQPESVMREFFDNVRKVFRQDDLYFVISGCNREGRV